jgi:hypothetical protein
LVVCADPFSFVFGNQGDQIRRIFAYWQIVFFGQFLEDYRSSNKNAGNFFPRKNVRINVDKNGLGCILGYLLANSSGHPAEVTHLDIRRPGPPRCQQFVRRLKQDP